MSRSILILMMAIAGCFCAGATVQAQGNFSQPPPGFNSFPSPSKETEGNTSPPPPPVAPRAVPDLNAGGSTNKAVVLPQGINVSEDYVISRADVISVSVLNSYSEVEFAVRGVRINNRGTLTTLPFVGEVKVDGLSILQAQKKIADLYSKDYFVNPSVQITLEAPTTTDFVITGQVGRAGTFQIPPDAEMTLIKAISNAGWFTRIANEGSVTIARKVNGQNQILKFNCKEILKGKANDPKVLPGDIINVPERWF
ncbi:MAG: polysaccharide biosynthesis/export family protein [Verrucomicrobiae bacterium]|nr:polysaccharide biosynthesis/export family protein [Verrucomicrobiae bacterium]